jgi:hypothetical protein
MWNEKGPITYSTEEQKERQEKAREQEGGE